MVVMIKKIEINSLTEAPALLIGTPGRIADHLRNNSFNPSTISTLILDEFDKSLEFGFQEEMSFIIESMKKLVAKDSYIRYSNGGNSFIHRIEE